MYGWNGTLFSGLLFTAIVFSCEKFKTGTMIRLSAKPLIGLLAEGKLHKKAIVLNSEDDRFLRGGRVKTSYGLSGRY